MYQFLERRHVAETAMNERSSRSHTIFKIIIESHELDNRDALSNVSYLVGII
jgi:hypothetical protein